MRKLLPLILLLLCPLCFGGVNLSTQTGTVNLSAGSEVTVGTFTSSAEGVVALRFNLSTMNGAAATVTPSFKILNSSGTLLLQNGYSAPKWNAADTVYGDTFASIPLHNGDKLVLIAKSSNASDSNVAWSMDVFDQTYMGLALPAASGGLLINGTNTAAAFSIGSLTTTGIVDTGSLSIGSSNFGAGTFTALNTGTMTFGTLALSNASNLSLLTIGTLTTYTGNTPQTGDSFARIGANGASLTSIARANQLPAFREWLVAASGGDYTTVAAAVSAAANGDTITIDGTYNESIDAQAKKLHFKAKTSTSGMTTAAGVPLKLGAGSTVDGLTCVYSGSAGGITAGILASADCEITRCVATGNSDGIYCGGSGVRIAYCTITSADDGLQISELDHVVIEHNYITSTATLAAAHAIDAIGTSGVIRHNTININSNANTSGTLNVIGFGGTQHLTLENNYIWGFVLNASATSPINGIGEESSDETTYLTLIGNSFLTFSAGSGAVKDMKLGALASVRDENDIFDRSKVSGTAPLALRADTRDQVAISTFAGGGTVTLSGAQSIPSLMIGSMTISQGVTAGSINLGVGTLSSLTVTNGLGVGSLSSGTFNLGAGTLTTLNVGTMSVGSGGGLTTDQNTILNNIYRIIQTGR